MAKTKRIRLGTALVFLAIGAVMLLANWSGHRLVWRLLLGVGIAVAVGGILISKHQARR